MLHDVEFAVIDVETTGLSPSRHHRIVEIAVVRVDHAGKVVDEYATLVNPQRDMGPTHIHGLTAREVRNAPLFREIAGDVVSRITGGVFVAHNVSFDLRFLRAELNRIGYQMAECPCLDTMHLAKKADPTIPGRKLEELCAHFGVLHEGAHSARGDAHATASLMAMCIARLGGPMELSLADIGVRGRRTEKEAWAPIPVSGKSCSRSAAAETSELEASYIARLVAKLPATTGLPQEIEDYLALLDQVLEDRRVTAGEAEELLSLSRDAGLSREQVLTGHRNYMRDLLRLAWEDGVVTDAEQEDLEEVRNLLVISPADYRELFREAEAGHALTPTDTPEGVVRSPEVKGKSICFTGTLRHRVSDQPVDKIYAERIASQRGMVVARGVTKKLDYLVVAAPDSMSKKADKARDYGVRIIAEPVFWRMMGIAID